MIKDFKEADAADASGSWPRMSDRCKPRLDDGGHIPTRYDGLLGEAKRMRAECKILRAEHNSLAAERDSLAAERGS